MGECCLYSFLKEFELGNLLDLFCLISSSEQRAMMDVDFYILIAHRPLGEVKLSWDTSRPAVHWIGRIVPSVGGLLLIQLFRGRNTLVGFSFCPVLRTGSDDNIATQLLSKDCHRMDVDRRSMSEPLSRM